MNTRLEPCFPAIGELQGKKKRFSEIYFLKKTLKGAGKGKPQRRVWPGDRKKRLLHGHSKTEYRAPDRSGANPRSFSPTHGERDSPGRRAISERNFRRCATDGENRRFGKRPNADLF